MCRRSQTPARSIEERRRANGADIAVDPTRTGCVHRRFTPFRARWTRHGSYAARRSRRHPVPSGGGSSARRLHQPHWRFRGRKIRGGFLLHLIPCEPKPARCHPQGAGSSGLRLRACAFFHRLPQTVRRSLPWPVSKSRRVCRRVENFSDFTTIFQSFTSSRDRSNRPFR